MEWIFCEINCNDMQPTACKRAIFFYYLLSKYLYNLNLIMSFQKKGSLGMQNIISFLYLTNLL